MLSGCVRLELRNASSSACPLGFDLERLAAVAFHPDVHELAAYWISRAVSYRELVDFARGEAEGRGWERSTRVGTRLVRCERRCVDSACGISWPMSETWRNCVKPFGDCRRISRRTATSLDCWCKFCHRSNRTSVFHRIDSLNRLSRTSFWISGTVDLFHVFFLFCVLYLFCVFVFILLTGQGLFPSRPSNLLGIMP